MASGGDDHGDSPTPDVLRLRTAALKIAAAVGDSFAEQNPLPRPVPIRDIYAWVRKTLSESYSLENYQIHCHLSEVDTDLGEVRSVVLIGENRSDIYVHSKNNICWKRFCLAKELIHIVLDREYHTEHRFKTEDLDAISEEVVYTNIFSDTCNHYPRMLWEKIGRACATRALVPEAFRKSLTDNLSQEKIASVLPDLANTLKVPRKALESHLIPLRD